VNTHTIIRTAGDWYAVQCRPGQHERAIENLRRQSFEVFAPHELTSVRRGSGWVARKSLYFPGYLFVEASACPKKVSSTRGVARILRGTGMDAATVPGLVIAELMEICSEGGEVLPVPEEEMVPGDDIYVSRGPLSGNWAKFEGLAPGDRIFALLEISKLRVELGRDTISRVSASQDAST